MAVQLDRTRIGMVANCSRLSGLTDLDLSLNKLGDEEVRILINSPHLTRLTDLDLRANDIGASGVRYLSTWTVHKQIRFLCLAGNHIGDAGARELLSWPNLCDLMLSGNDIGPGWVAALVDSPLLGRLTSLWLTGSSIGNEGVRLLAEYPWSTRLLSLDLGYNNIGPTAISYLVRATWLRGLKGLDLGFNPIKSGGAKALASLAALGHLPKLKTLDLQHTRIGDVGACALVDSPLSNQLEWLDLTGNRISKAVVSRLRERMGDRLEI